jgi:hypothetical protein
MVCPYKAVTGFITTILSILYVYSTFADPDTKNTREFSSLKWDDDDDETARKGKNKASSSSSSSSILSSARRLLLVTVLVLFHVDLFTTGYVRLGVKHVIGNVKVIT